MGPLAPCSDHIRCCTHSNECYPERFKQSCCTIQSSSTTKSSCTTREFSITRSSCSIRRSCTTRNSSKTESSCLNRSSCRARISCTAQISFMIWSSCTTASEFAHNVAPTPCTPQQKMERVANSGAQRNCLHASEGVQPIRSVSDERHKYEGWK